MLVMKSKNSHVSSASLYTCAHAEKKQNSSRKKHASKQDAGLLSALIAGLTNSEESSSVGQKKQNTTQPCYT